MYNGGDGSPCSTSNGGDCGGSSNGGGSGGGSATGSGGAGNTGGARTGTVSPGTPGFIGPLTPSEAHQRIIDQLQRDYSAYLQLTAINVLTGTGVKVKPGVYSPEILIGQALANAIAAANPDPKPVSASTTASPNARTPGCRVRCGPEITQAYVDRHGWTSLNRFITDNAPLLAGLAAWGACAAMTGGVGAGLCLVLQPVVLR